MSDANQRRSNMQLTTQQNSAAHSSHLQDTDRSQDRRHTLIATRFVWNSVNEPQKLQFKTYNFAKVAVPAGNVTVALNARTHRLGNVDLALIGDSRRQFRIELFTSASEPSSNETVAKKNCGFYLVGSMHCMLPQRSLSIVGRPFAAHCEPRA